VHEIDDGVEASGGLDIELDSGTIGDSGELILEERRVGEDVVGLDGDERDDTSDQVEAGQPDGIATAKINRGEEKAERNEDGIPCAEDGADGGEKAESGEEPSARG